MTAKPPLPEHASPTLAMTAKTGPSPCVLPCASLVRDRVSLATSAPTHALHTNAERTTNLATHPQKQALHRGGATTGHVP